MKFVAVSVVVFAALIFKAQAALTAEQVARIASNRKFCEQSSKIDAESLNSIRSGSVKESPAVKEYFACMAKKCDFVNQDGVLQKPLIAKKLAFMIEDQALASKLTEECAVSKSDATETGFNLIKCIFEKYPKLSSIL